ncbi:MAG: deoxyguanosinetriphosphate triphosphohydrolase [Dehalococcoidales bacterium]|nr:deoxyguanosinetriphosphate triphosphohydrolase [Dehalococcoidales bacterium]
MIERLKIRQTTEQKEESLSPYAVKSRLSKGREKPEDSDPIRTVFQRDRDRIIHCKAFRRLKHKTQVFIMPSGDHYVTRLTHTLEVSQIARTIARALNLNEDLTEAISLGHDLGHTPFGHIGEGVLNELYPGGFHHNEQSLRVVEKLEKDGRGLNLTWEVRNGILHHSKTGVEKLFGKDWGEVGSFEGEICKIADMIAYINHDIGDAIRANLITEDDLPKQASEVLGHSHSARINRMVSDIVEFSWGLSGKGRGKVKIGMSPAVLKAAETMRDFLFARVYNSATSKAELSQAKKTIRFLYRYFNKHENKMPPEFRAYADETARRVVDYVSGMTDQYALNLAKQLQL